MCGILLSRFPCRHSLCFEKSIFTAITCSPLADPINGTVSYSDAADGLGNYVFNVTANHSCDTGFDLFGNNTSTCTGDGSSTTGAFDREAPNCERECKIIVTIKKTVQSFNEQKHVCFVSMHRCSCLIIITYPRCCHTCCECGGCAGSSRFGWSCLWVH